MKKQMPVTIGEKYSIIITNLSHNAEGVGRYDGFAVFVPGAISGDEVEVEIISTKKNYARGLITRLIKPSKYRITPKCEVSEVCGGCQLQHLNYAEQLVVKQNQVKEALTRVGGLENIPVSPVLGMKDPWQYRNKASFPIGGQAGRIKAGFYQNRTHNLIDINYCDIQHPLINKSLIIIKKLINILEIKPYDERTHAGVLRHLVIRVAPGTNEVLVILVATKDIGQLFRQLATNISQEILEIKGIVLNINNRLTNVIMGDQELTLLGRNYIVDKLLGKSFIISARSFYQINAAQTPLLYQQVLDKADLAGHEIVVDAYCGTGTIGLILAECAKQVIGVELIPAAIKDARCNAELNKIKNTQFHVGKAERVLPELVNKGLKPDIVVVDPPRKGCEKSLLRTIAQVGVAKIIYVSCNPATLARDLAFLVEQGYLVGEVQPVDMFPHSGHVESVVGLVLPSFHGCSHNRT